MKERLIPLFILGRHSPDIRGHMAAAPIIIPPAAAWGGDDFSLTLPIFSPPHF